MFVLCSGETLAEYDVNVLRLESVVEICDAVESSRQRLLVALDRRSSAETLQELQTLADSLLRPEYKECFGGDSAATRESVFDGLAEAWAFETHPSTYRAQVQ